jgi:CRP/FNR family cyclic AMP-dependent transcriptional regulator
MNKDFEKLIAAERFSNEQVLTYKKGDVIFTEGDSGRELYIIQSGSVLISKKTEIGKLDLVTFQRGEFFGEMALLQSVPRYASAHALEDKTTLLVMQPAAFLVKIRRDPTLAFEMLQQLSYRLKISVERMLSGLTKSGQDPAQVQEILNSINPDEQT